MWDHPEKSSFKARIGPFLLKLIGLALILVLVQLTSSFLQVREDQEFLSKEKYLFRDIKASVSSSTVSFSEMHLAYSVGMRMIHGIVRRLPLHSYAHPGSEPLPLLYSFSERTLDGESVDAANRETTDHLEVRIGNAKKALSKGDHRFGLKYLVSRAVHTNAFGYSSLIWPLNEDVFLRTDRLEAKIGLPKNTNLKDVKAECWLSVQGERSSPEASSQACSCSIQDSQLDLEPRVVYQVNSLRTLNPGEQLWISLKW